MDDNREFENIYSEISFEDNNKDSLNNTMQHLQSNFEDIKEYDIYAATDLKNNEVSITYDDLVDITKAANIQTPISLLNLPSLVKNLNTKNAINLKILDLNVNLKNDLTKNTILINEVPIEFVNNIQNANHNMQTLDTYFKAKLFKKYNYHMFEINSATKFCFSSNNRPNPSECKNLLQSYLEKI